MRPIAPATADDAATIAAATDKLREARDLLRLAGAPRAAKAVARALKSADGAGRHVAHRVRRSTAGMTPHNH
jgi:alkylated DNA nucleotide flippase Atl1